MLCFLKRKRKNMQKLFSSLTYAFFRREHFGDNCRFFFPTKKLIHSPISRSSNKPLLPNKKAPAPRSFPISSSQRFQHYFIIPKYLKQPELTLLSVFRPLFHSLCTLLQKHNFRRHQNHFKTQKDRVLSNISQVQF